MEVPEWNGEKCSQCNYCSVVCPHAVIRPFLIEKAHLSSAPASFESRKAKGGGFFDGFHYRVQVSPYDCTGCRLCVNVCPDEALHMRPVEEMVKQEADNWEYAMTLPERLECREINRGSVKGSQFMKPLLEFSGACSGCGETPYVKMLTQLFGERMMIANATGEHAFFCFCYIFLS